MVEPAKPFACTIPDCGMTFTNEDHLHVHTKKHDMILQLGAEQRANFVADQTPTPTRFIRNCEEVGLFQDLQNVTVNPFDEGFKRAMETKQGVLLLEGALPSDDVLHTPQMVFPVLEAESAVFTNNQRNVTISRSSSDESGTLKEFKTTTISKLTNEVSTISRIVGNRDTIDKITDDVIKSSHILAKDNVETIYKNIKIHSNVEIRKDNINNENSDASNRIPVLIYTDTVIKDSVVTKDVLLTDNSKLDVDKIPIMSQKSLDLVVDSLTSELNNDLGDKHDDLNSDLSVAAACASEKTDAVCDQKIISDENNDANPTKGEIYSLGDNRTDSIRINQNKCTNTNLKPPKKLRVTNLDANKTVNEITNETKNIKNDKDDIEVIIKLPDGKKVHMKAVEDSKTHTKEVLRKTIESKKNKANELLTSIVPNIIPLPGTLIPVTLLNPGITPVTVTNNVILPKVPISLNPNATKVVNVKEFPLNVNLNNYLVTNLPKKSINRPNNVRKNVNLINTTSNSNDVEERLHGGSSNCGENDKNNGEDDDCVIEKVTISPEAAKRTRIELDSRSAASKRYRARLKDTMKKQSDENRQLKELNQQLIAENAVLKILITEHMKKCPSADDLRIIQERLKNGGADF